MIKTLTFGDKQVSFSTSFAWCFIYKSQFHEDPARILIPVTKKMTEEQTDSAEDYGYALYEALGFVAIADIAWAMARLLDQSIPDPVAWVASFGDDFDITAVMLELIPEAIESCFATKKSSVPIPATTQKAAPETKRKK